MFYWEWICQEACDTGQREKCQTVSPTYCYHSEQNAKYSYTVLHFFFCLNCTTD